MRFTSEEEIFGSARSIVVDCEMMDAPSAFRQFNCGTGSVIKADGSSRRFWRIEKSGSSNTDAGFLVVAPAATGEANLEESESVWRIGRHLGGCGVKVPRIYGWDPSNGVLVMEDLGHTRLYDLVQTERDARSISYQQIEEIYSKVIDSLIAMQIAGAVDFDPSWCWDSPRYDAKLMVEKESNYFLDAFWQGLLGNEISQSIREEFTEIARRAAEAPSSYFLHRDFQSRNIMVRDGDPWFIDFQGGRLGPLGYDLASLLIDPYCDLDEQLQHNLFDHYCTEISHRIELDISVFKYHYKYLYLQRNLQIIGAFSYLSRVKGKPFFESFIIPTVRSLHKLVEQDSFNEFSTLRTTARNGLQQLTS